LEDEAGRVELARGGDGPAFAWLFHRYNAPICAYLARLVGDDELGRDLAQETFIHAWKGLPALSGELQFRPWLYRIATNTARSHLRHTRLLHWLPWHEQRDNALLSSDGPEEQAGENEQIHQILARLAPQARVCLLLQLYAGFSQREIAAVLKISEKSVSAYVSRGREQFRQLYHQTKGGLLS
jgi:RNA polymerase sigma-70 factor (ECF subfamily)